MENMDPKKTQPKDELDHLLDATLAKYADVDPRAGLENRILANLRSAQPIAHPWWGWGLAAVVAAMLIVLALSLRSTKPHPVVANHPQAPSQPALPVVRQAVRRGIRVSRRSGVASSRAASEHRVDVGAAEDPKLDTFPSPQPLSEEELALARYVWNFPGDAKLVAQAQEADAQEVLRRMLEQANEPTKSN
jgi:hypothetical protein